MFYAMVALPYLVLFAMIIKQRATIKRAPRKLRYQIVEFVGLIVTVGLLYLLSGFNLQTTTEQIKNVTLFTVASTIIWWVILFVARSLSKRRLNE